MKKIEYHAEIIQLPIPWDSEGTAKSVRDWAHEAQIVYLDRLNELGAEGWELLEAWPEPDASPATWLAAFFKRET
jgi:hypothetical protein